MMLPKSPKVNELFGLGKKDAPKKGVSFSPITVAAMAIAIHFFLGFEIVVSIVIALVIHIFMFMRKAAKQQASNLPPLPPAETENEKDERVAILKRADWEDSQVDKTSHPVQTTSADLNTDYEWGRDKARSTTQQHAEQPVVYELPEIASQGIVIEKPTPFKSNYKSLASSQIPQARLKIPAGVPKVERVNHAALSSLNNLKSLREAMVTLAVLGPCKANEKPGDKKQFI